MAAGAVAVLLATGCSASVSATGSVSKEEVAKRASAALGEKVGRVPDSVTCEDDLKAEKGATVRCELAVDGEKQGLTATTASVGGGKAEIDFKVDDGPGAGTSAAPEPTGPPNAGAGAPAVDKAEVARQGKAALAARTGRQPDALACQEDLPARVGATVRCQLAADGEQYGVTVTAKSVDGDDVRMDFAVDDSPGG
ncbi:MULTISPECIES: DUF4333 domain-containing protein [Streptomyces]|uniref:DUF4333 domain-containing protein n=1 Tax=Streptomyces rutgersensis TaxID=53451 RepID=A0ABX6RVE4_9ACTN|nr:MULTISPECIES: DUF4333 domain-containing protein [Streptomyces]NEE48363.1 DUF4333 domain-containing protein [Streptomyces sp. SID8455]MBL3806397.1 DUF4333 domain-containing protein [Streptomyces sp. BRB081]PJM85615.1 hypothetical protein CH313_01410 [Streptomyces sp. TSRI0384-2]QNE84748.1 DUF4333 domain-containing protein [Streptomyces rutgersensis]WPR54692.1 DUF4333 domain-containing protein [Streptomyces sp. S399]